MKLQKGEWVICPAIWVDDGKKYNDQPLNIKTGYVQYGLHLVDVFYRMTRKGTGQPINIETLRVHEISEGYYTNFKRFVKDWIDDLP